MVPVSEKINVLYQKMTKSSPRHLDTLSSCLCMAYLPSVKGTEGATDSLFLKLTFQAVRQEVMTHQGLKPFGCHKWQKQLNNTLRSCCFLGREKTIGMANICKTHLMRCRGYLLPSPLQAGPLPCGKKSVHANPLAFRRDLSSLPLRVGEVAILNFSKWLWVKKKTLGDHRFWSLFPFASRIQ